MDNIELLLSELEGEIMDGKKSLFSSSSVSVNGDRIMELINRIRSNYPEELRQAKIIIEERDTIKADTKAHVEKMLSDAKERESNMVAESQIVKKATKEADDIIKEVTAYKERTLFQVNRLVDEHLKSIEDKISTVLNYVRNAREELKGDMIKNRN